MYKYLIIIQARFKSTRYEGKILKKYKSYSLLEILIKRLTISEFASKIVVACTHDVADNAIIEICKKIKINYVRGDNDNLINRYKKVLKSYPCKNIIRITSDCPFSDPELLDDMIKFYEEKNLDYLSNNKPASFPDGFDVEIFKSKILNKLSNAATNSLQKEHVTSHIKNVKNLKVDNYKNKKDFSNLRLTIDEPKDYELIKIILKNFDKKIFRFRLKDIENLYMKNKKLFNINSEIKRDEGFNLSNGQKFWKRAKNVIPGGTMLFSKNPNLFLPNKWPAYYSKTKGCFIWDLEKKKYIDLSFMGVGTNILGYNNKFVDKAVKDVIKAGNISTLNSKEEIFLAEKLVEMNKWSKYVRFARTGGEASSIAIRIARAATNRDKIAVCGYHGWQDWYLAANLENEKNLDKHLMKNLPIKGVPHNYKDNIKTFQYNDFLKLNKIINQNSLAAVIMEVSRDEKPKNDFLKKVRQLTEKKKIPLIFDECTSGFRETFGGLHYKYGVNPDIVIYGKALGNGYAINAVVGKEEIMKESLKTFISSTFWTERIGSAAAIETLNQMEKLQSWKIITKTGKMIKKSWKDISEQNKVKIQINGLDAIPKFIFDKNNLLYKSFITSELLKKNILGGNAVYVCTEHKTNIINNYLDALNDIFYQLSNMSDQEILKKINQNVCIGGIRDLR
mgnify:FL=1